MAPKETVTLNNGAKMPVFGLGTFLANNPEELKVALNTALDNGYRLIDTAAFYKNEGIIGSTLKEIFDSGKLKREDVFIVTKLPPMAMFPDKARECIDEQLSQLQLDYVDLYLIHTPACMVIKDPTILKREASNFEFHEVPHIDTWRVLEEYHKQGKLKAIGVSNFNAQQIRDLYNKATVKPANLQVECTIYWPQEELLALCKELNMSFTAYSTLGNPGRAAAGLGEQKEQPLQDPVILELATKYGKTPAQILLRHQIQRGVLVIPKSTNPKRVIENSQLDFTISDDDMKKVNAIKTRVRAVDFKFAVDHPQFPFHDILERERGQKK